MATTIVTKSGSGAPTASDLVAGELAVDLTNKRLYTEDSGGTVLELGTNPSGDITFGDNGKAIFGAGSDLQIYHDGTHSYVADAGAGSLFLRSGSNIYVQNAGGTENYFKGTDGGAAELFHNGSSKLATTASGIDVTGSVTADGLTIVAADAALAASIGSNDQRVYITPNGTEINYNASGNSAGSHMFQTGNIDRLNIASNGDISFYEDTGTTPKLFWDASAEALGIGTSSVSAPLTIGYSGAEAQLQINNSGDNRMVYLGAFSENEGVVRLFNSSNVETVRIAAESTAGVHTYFNGGNVGIGTDLPSVPLHIENSASTSEVLRLGSSTVTHNTGIYMRSTGTSSISWGSGGNLAFYGGGAGTTERMRIDSSGYLNIGVSTAISSSTNTADGFTFAPSGGYAWLSVSDVGGIYVQRQDDNNVFSFYRGTSGVGSISVTSSATAYNTSSDQRLKDNIVDAPSASSDIDAIQVRSFDWKVNGSHQKYGMVAQELLTVAPEAVSAPEDPDEMMGVDYSKLVPMMLKEIQSLRARVAQLES